MTAGVVTSERRQGEASTALVAVEDLAVQFGTLTVFEGLGFSIDAGEFVSFLGPSGCGKSTLLRVLAGLLRPTAGRVFRHDRRTEQPGLRIGMMFQKPLLLGWRTTLENVLLPVELEGGRKVTNEQKEKALQILELVQLQDFARAYPGQLSGGMQQRAALARTLMTDPDLLLLDEPFGALDELTRETLNEELLRIWQSPATRLSSVVMVTHSIPEAVALSDRVFVFGTRPARVREIVPVPLSHPRSPESADFSRVLGHLRAVLKEVP